MTPEELTQIAQAHETAEMALRGARFAYVIASVALILSIVALFYPR